MAGLTSTFHHPCKSQLSKPLKPFSFHHLSLSFRIHSPTTTRRYPFISTTHHTISARYGGGGGGGRGASRRSKPSDDEALDISSIRSDTVRLIDEQQKMVGLVSKAQAFQMAEDAELDLVILSPDADPPVVRIMDYNKYRYEQQKKKRDQQKKSAASRMDLKELKMGYNIDVHDYSVRLRAAQKFLKDGDKVKVIVSLKGRENEFRNNAIELIRRFQNDVGERLSIHFLLLKLVNCMSLQIRRINKWHSMFMLATEETKNFRDRNIYIVLVPNKAVAQKSQEPPKKKDNYEVNEVSASV